MSPIRLADFDSDSDDSEGQSVSQDDNDRMLRESTWESTYPRIDGEWATGDEVNEPVAIVGIGCRLPGDVKSAADLWDLLKEEKSGHGKVPKERWNIDAFHHEDGGEKIGSMSMDSGYFIHEDLRKFENSFFGINNVEATYMDPQQRKLLEIVYECLENAGIPLEDVKGSNTGVFAGSFTLDYWMMQTREPDYLSRYHATGMGTTILSNRISHALNLVGPSFTLDTGCSSSLYSLHQAVSALDANECDAAIVCASNLLQSPEQQLGTMKAGVLSPTGTCHTFDDQADGYGRADGLAALYLKKLSKAIADGDPIRALVRGSAVNANGKTMGISLPSATGQEAVMRKAYAKAGIDDLTETDYIECHGTGTPVGDPIEVEGVSRVFKRDISKGPVLIGSVKTNLGHSEATSGLSSIIKATLILENGVIPATVGVKNINPKIHTDEWGVKIVTSPTDWPKSANGQVPQTKRVGINSFGYGGANSHAILDAPSPYLDSMDHEMSQMLANARSTFLIPLSASKPAALVSQAERLAAFVARNPHTNVVDLARTLGTRRSKLSERGYALVGQKTLGEDLQAENLQSVLPGRIYSAHPFAFVFTGQGAQWPQMGKELITEFPSFKKSIQELDSVLQKLSERPTWTLEQAILEPPTTSQINHVTRSQPVCTAVQVALIDLLSKWGVTPKAVIGHSSGEIAAAYASGRLTSTQAIIVAFYRGYVVGKSNTKVPGAMMAATLSKEQADIEIEQLDLVGSILVACVNSNESVTFSGDEAGIDTLWHTLTQRGIFARKLNTNGRAYHSQHMKPLGQEYEDLLEKNMGLPVAPPSLTGDLAVTWISSVYGEPVSAKIMPSYWRKNLESPVLFSDAAAQLMMGKMVHLLELGPHSAMEMPLKQIAKKLKIKEGHMHYNSAIIRPKNSVHSVLNLMGQLFLHGHDVSFADVNYVQTFNAPAVQGNLLTNLPPYSWTYDSHVLWNEGRQSRELRNRKYGHHELLGLQMLGGSGIVTTWRNMLKVKDVPWLESHKLGEDIVFPAAGFIAMAVESICQVLDIERQQRPRISLRNFHVIKALPISSDNDNAGAEIFTTLRPLRISGTTQSNRWHDFEVSTYDDSKYTIHATGIVSATLRADKFPPKLSLEGVDLHALAIRNWYDKFAAIGLNFGSHFQTMKKIETDSKRRVMKARATVDWNGSGANEGPTRDPANDKKDVYIMHPVLIDSMLQTALVASSAGHIANLVCMVPTSIEEANFIAPYGVEQSTSLVVDAISEKTGLASLKIAAELHGNNGELCGQMENVTAVAFQGIQHDQSVIDERHPMMKVIWKPDITKLTPTTAPGLSKHLAQVAARLDDRTLPSSLGKLAEMVCVFAHKKPRLNILELGGPSGGFARSALGLLRAGTTFPRYASYARGYYSDTDELLVEDFTTIDAVTDDFAKAKPHEAGAAYDLIVCSDSSIGQEIVTKRHEAIGGLLTSQGAVVGLVPAGFPGNPDLQLSMTDVPIGDSAEKIIVGKIPTRLRGSDPHRTILVERGDNTGFDDKLCEMWESRFGESLERVLLSVITIASLPPGTSVICTVELYEPILTTLTESEMSSMKIMTDQAEYILWVHGGGNMDAKRPDLAMVTGFSRSLVLEQPSLRFFTHDIDDPDADPEASINNIFRTLDDVHSHDCQDLEVVEKDGVPFTQRFVPEEGLNETFRQRQGNRFAIERLGDNKPVRLTIQSIGQFDTLAFEPETSGRDELKAGYVEVDVKSVGLNAKDVFVYTGKVETRNATTSLECAGIITRTGSDVSSLKRGDRVVVMAPGHFSTLESFPEWSCEKLTDSEDFNIFSTLPLVFATAIYALCDCANLQQGETVLIHSGAGGVGIAAIQIAHLRGAEVYTTVSTQEKKDYLVEKLGVKRENIFNSRDSSFLLAIMVATKNRGVDVVLNSLVGDLLHDSFRACARFGRFVEIGKKDLTDAGRLDMQIFKRNVSYTAFDVSELCDVDNKKVNVIWTRLLQDVMGLYRDGKIKAFDPLKVFGAAEISEAFRYFSGKNRMGKIAISYEDDASMVKILPTKYDCVFSPTKTYLMSGCLGGIGRSITKWMMTRGAKKFAMIGRSGLDKEPARRLVKDLEDAGAYVHVTRGDVGDFKVVEEAVAAIEGEIGGVVQAAMGLDEAIWTSMSNQSWHTSVKPKVQGSWNLHNGIKGKDSALEFFLMTSSVAGSVGTATESNYTAANSFMDNFAKYRRKRSLPATSIGLGAISEVGYLHENPEIEAVLLRKGITPIKEDELLSIIDITLSRQNGLEPTEAHVLTGLETQGMKKLRRMGFEGTIPTLNDPRASILASSLDGEADLHSKKTDSGLPPALAATLEAGGDTDAVLDTVTDIVVGRLANLILVPASKIDREMPLMKWGMDSMLGAEYRTWFFMAFGVDIPFLFLLGDVVTPRALGEMVVKDMLAAGRFTIDG